MAPGSLQLAARVAGAAALAAALAYAPVDLLHVWRDVRNAHAVPRAERARAPAESVGIGAAQEVQAAAAVIPRGARYLVVTGSRAPLRGPGSADFVGFWASYSLLPRRRVSRLAEAGWVLSYGADLRSLGVRFRRVVALGRGVQVAEVAR